MGKKKEKQEYEKREKKLRGETEAVLKKEVSIDCEKCPMNWLRQIGGGCSAKPWGCETYLLFSKEED